MLSLSLEDGWELDCLGSCAASGKAAASSRRNSAARIARLQCRVVDARELVDFMLRIMALAIVIFTLRVRMIIHTLGSA